MGISTLFSFGITQAVAYYTARREFTLSEMATATVAIGFTQSALSIGISLLVLPFVLKGYSPAVQSLGVLVVLLMPALILGSYTASLFQGQQDLLRFNIIRVVAPFTYAAGLAGLYLAHLASLKFVIVSQMTGYAVSLALGWAMVWRVLRPRPKWNASAIPRLIHFGFRTHITSLANYFNQRIDQMLLSLLVPPRDLGFYVVAVTLSTTVTMFPQAAGIVTFSKGSSQHSEDAKATIGASFRASLIWLVVGCSGLFVLSPFLIRFVFGPAFDGSILACRILVPGAFMIGMNQVLYNGASSLGRPGLPSFAEGTSMAVTALGLYLLVPRYGYIGAAIVSSIAYTVSFLVMLGLAHRELGLSLWVLLGARRGFSHAGS
jgi:O-antigen/teichoic acid export membrane protein